MTKSLGRTYSLLNFSGREMHYWPSNLPRRRVCVMSLGMSCTCDVIAMLHPLVLVFRKRTQRATPLALLILLSFSFSGSRVVALTLLRKGTCPGTLSHVRKVTARLLFLQMTMSPSQKASARNLNGEIRLRGDTPEQSRTETKYVL